MLPIMSCQREGRYIALTFSSLVPLGDVLYMDRDVLLHDNDKSLLIEPYVQNDEMAEIHMIFYIWDIATGVLRE